MSPAATRRILLDCLLIVLACVPVYWLWLGASGFSASEGHRVAPAWEILRTGDWLVTRMFEQVYVRKPPGMPWAIAVFTKVLGHTEFAARAVSAMASTLGPLVTYWFSRRWFIAEGADGARAAWTGAPLAAGLAHVLTPLFWSAGRSAEIEALHGLGVQLAALASVDVLVGGRHRGGRVATNVLAIFAGIVIAGLAKGPAGAPVLIGVFAGCCLAARSLRPLAHPAAYLAIFSGLGVLGLIAGVIARRLASLDEPVVAQSPGEFLWASSRVLQTLTLPLVSFAAALPVSLALLFPWGSDARRERAAGYLVARALAWSWIVCLLFDVAIGISNPRYAAPAATLLPALSGYVFAGAVRGRAPAPAFARSRVLIARVMMLGHPRIAAGVLLIGATLYAHLTTVSRDRDSGRAFGRQIAAIVQGPCEVFANHAVEARPEVLLEARRAAADVGVLLRPRWHSPSLADLPARTDPREARYLLLRLDAASDEGEVRSVLQDSLSVRLRGRVGPYELGLFQVIDPQSGDEQFQNGGS